MHSPLRGNAAAQHHYVGKRFTLGKCILAAELPHHAEPKLHHAARARADELKVSALGSKRASHGKLSYNDVRRIKAQITFTRGRRRKLLSRARGQSSCIAVQLATAISVLCTRVYIYMSDAQTGQRKS